ncbi:MAG: cytochrome c oxidase assembly protein [SAR86 cluster bacterium]|uniref:Cytochrome c oxidase assembly protein CtaG n=1 Tax=SAR86 cluster bacterium TaxID=2030880 RepID=A0A2A5CI27_9GAMM|nr:cytochrome c oxidase assembly protein [Gammaproteobacteria bacterium AH-315-E17]PCJ43529.1 MAG: cytochrome c oxidase assembly protein [SAR86 cluster bacterium]
MSETPDKQTNQPPKNSRLVQKLLLGAVGMFGFGFALVPLYDVFCDITGLNGKTGGRYAYEAAEVEVNEERLVTVQFRAMNNAGMSWQFEPMVRQVEVHPGELTEVMFYARNPSSSTIVGQAVPSVSPFRSADYLHKTECFCFSQQTLLAGEEIDMPLRFFIDQDIPEEITKLTLSYTLFDVTANFQRATSSL